MNNISGYSEHVEIVKNLKMHSDFTNVREPYKEDFEKIRQEAQDQGVTMVNAKDFLNSLSEEELSTVQHYTGLADEIKVGKLSQEGAYNLLLKHYEKFDFNQDGIIEDGVARTGSLIPINMPTTEKKALVESLNQMDEDDRFKSMMLINLPDRFVLDETGSYVPVNDEKRDFKYIMDLLERVINPEPMSYTSPELKELASRFKTIFEENYEKQKELESNHQVNNESSSNIMKARLS